MKEKIKRVKQYMKFRTKVDVFSGPNDAMYVRAKVISVNDAGIVIEYLDDSKFKEVSLTWNEVTSIGPSD